MTNAPGLGPLGIAIVLACAALVAFKAATASPPVPRRQATDAERAELARLIAKHERDWTDETAGNFPDDNWSQRDDFHGREFRKVLDLVHEKGVRIEDILGAVDDDIHARPAATPDAHDARHARAVPCKPRPFYD